MADPYITTGCYSERRHGSLNSTKNVGRFSESDPA